MASRHLMAQRERTLKEKIRDALDRVLEALSPPNVGLLLVITLSYFVTGKFGQLLAIPDPAAIALWPPTGISLAAVFFKGKKALPGILLGAFLVNVTETGLILVSAGIAVGNTLEAVAGVFLVNRFANGVNAFLKPADVLRYVALAGVLPTICCAASGVTILCVRGVVPWSDFQKLLSFWWVGDMLGAIILGPFLILMFGFRHHRLSFAEVGELCVLFAGLTTMCLLNFGPQYIPWTPKLFFGIAFLLWAAVRFCPLEVSAACLVMAGFAVSGSLRGFGPFANTATAPFMVAAYVIVYSVAAMVVAAALTAQKKEMAELYLEYYRLKDMSVENENQEGIENPSGFSSL
jgi:integral membrane sensor domain MASE1